jgi:6-phosphogluconolactonase
MLSEHRFTDQSALLNELREFSLARILHDLAHYPEITLLLSGGSTPLPFYRDFGRQNLPWDRLHLALVDERWVAPSQPGSNERTLREALGPKAAARLTGMYDGSSVPAAALPEVSHSYTMLPRPWTLGLLGMGPDGHTASLFPGAFGLAQALSTFELCAALTAKRSEVTGDNTERMTLSLSALLGIEHLVLLFTGEAKWRVYEEALATGKRETLPVSYLLQQDAVSLDVFWCP